MAGAITEWAMDDRPREKMMAHGADALSKAELLAILIGSGVPGLSAVDLMRRILSDYEDSLKSLGRATIEDLCAYPGVGPAKAVTILAACQLANRRLEENINPRQRVQSSLDIFDYFRPRMQDLTVEECHLLMLNNNLQIIGSVVLSRGGLTSASVDVRELLRHALLRQSPAVALAHNHPSGNPNPSKDDDQLTAAVQQACRTVKIRLIDHIIVAGETYYSYQDNNKL